MKCLFLTAGACLVAVLFAPVYVTGTTIYVDSGQTTNTEDGVSWATAYQTITNGLAGLATANGIVAGGHTVAVRGGPYGNQLDFTASHAGVDGAPNTLQAVGGDVTINGAGIVLTDSPYIVLDGITVNGASGIGIDLAGSVSDNVVISNCAVLACGNTGIDLGTADDTLIHGCVIAGNGADGVYNFSGNGLPRLVQSIVYGNEGYGWRCRLNSGAVWNSVIVANGLSGLYEFGSGDLRATNNVFYANGECNFNKDYDQYLYNTASNINNISYCSGNIVGNPGFTDTANWNFNEVYADSVCLGNGLGGMDIGAFQSPPTVPVSSNTYYVDSGGSDANNGLSPGNAWATLTNAAAQAVAGDTVIVQAGTYAGRVDIVRGGSVNPVTYKASGTVIIDGGNSDDAGFYLDRVIDVELDGFEVTDFTSAGVRLNICANIGLRNGNYHNNGAYGVDCLQSEYVTVEDTVIDSNGNYGVDARDRSRVLVSRCLVANHTYGIRNWKPGSLVEVVNSIIRDSSTYGVGYRENSGTTVLNCAFYGNTRGCWAGYKATGWLRNCILAGGDYGVYEPYSKGRAVVENCCFDDNSIAHYLDTGGGGALTNEVQINALADCVDNIVDDPIFLDVVNNDFRLDPASPCIDAGTTDTSLEVDYYGNARLVGSAVDIGIYEYAATAPGSIFLIQ
jgi:hypothetical protein